MRIIFGFLAASLLLCATGHSQVINGEGNYEGSSLHTPPQQADAEASPRTDDRKKAPQSKTPAEAPPTR